MKMLSEILLLVVAFFIIIYLSARLVFAPTNVNPMAVGTACINRNCFQVEIAKTPAERDRGLMFRNVLDKDKGMLFIFDKDGIYPFWMKNTLIPLDIVWIDSNYKVVFISQNVQPCKSLICPSVIPIARAKYVLEINGGLCEELQIKTDGSVGLKIEN